MVIDSSVWVAVVLGEADGAVYLAAIDAAIQRSEPIYIPASSITEAGIVLDRRGRGDAFNSLLKLLRPIVVAIDANIAAIARQAYGRFGRGIHKAQLNFCDCLSYAVCAGLGDRLLFKGNDFVHTGIPSAL